MALVVWVWLLDRRWALFPSLGRWVAWTRLLGRRWARSSSLGRCSALLIVGLYVGSLGGAGPVVGPGCWVIAGMALRHWVGATLRRWAVVLGVRLEAQRKGGMTKTNYDFRRSSLS